MRSLSSVYTATSLFSSGPGSKKKRGNQAEEPSSSSITQVIHIHAGEEQSARDYLQRKSNASGVLCTWPQWRLSLHTPNSVHHTHTHTRSDKLGHNSPCSLRSVHTNGYCCHGILAGLKGGGRHYNHPSSNGPLARAWCSRLLSPSPQMEMEKGRMCLPFPRVFQQDDRR